MAVEGIAPDEHPISSPGIESAGLATPFFPQPSSAWLEFQDASLLDRVSYRNLGWSDLTGDGLDEVLAVKHTSTGPDYHSGSYEVTALNGRSGRKLWTARESYENDGNILLFEERVGVAGKNGVLLYKGEGDNTTWIGISNRGKRVYSTEVVRSSWGPPGEQADYEELYSVGFFNGLEGRATDILFGYAVGIGTFIPRGDLGFYLRATSSARATILDGRDGSLTVHDELDQGLKQAPVPQIASDMDGDGLDDYAVVNVLPEIQRDPETGIPITPDPDMMFTRARKGTTGEALWLSEPMKVEPAPFTINLTPRDSSDFYVDRGLSDVTGDTVGDLLVAAHRFDPLADEQTIDDYPLFMLDGTNGDISWTAKGSPSRYASVSDLGRIDKDDTLDLLTVTFEWTEETVENEVIAYSGATGKKLYRRSYPLKGAVPPTNGTSAGGWGSTWGVALGDLAAEGSTDWEISTHWFNETGSDHPDDRFFLDGRTGRKLLPKPAGFSLQRSIDLRGDDLIGTRVEDTSLDVFDGRDNSVLLSLTLKGLVSDIFFPWMGLGTARMNRDKCVDLVATVDDGTGIHALMIDGGSGRVLWTRRQSGRDLGDVELENGADNNPAC